MRKIVELAAGLSILFLALVASASTGIAAPANGADHPSCKLVPKAEVEALIGQPLEDLSISVAGGCDYRSKNPRRLLVSIKLYSDTSKATFESDLKNAAKMLKASVKPIPGLGEEAFSISDFQIAVYQHNSYITVTFMGGSLSAAKIDAITRKAIKRM
jgi:hypothetical protein